MKKEKSSKDQSSKLAQSTTFRLPGPGDPSDQIPNAVRGGVYDSIAEVLRAARSHAYRAVNFVMVEAYWNIGRMIVEEEQQGKDRAEYGTNLLRHLSAGLTREFGKGLNYTNLKYIRQFYITYPIGHALRDQFSLSSNAASDRAEGNRHALRGELTWTHYRLLIRVEKPEAREWYMNEAADQNWSTRALERQINTF